MEEVVLGDSREAEGRVDPPRFRFPGTISINQGKIQQSTSTLNAISLLMI